MKIGVSSYNYRDLLAGGAFTYYDAIDHAKKVGFDLIEFVDIPAEDGATVIQTAERLRAHCEKVGIGVGAYAVYADFLNPAGGSITSEVERVKGCVDVAKALGAPCMRHDATWGSKGRPMRYTWRDAVEEVAPAIRQVAEYAQSQGVRTMTENHGTFLQSSARMEALVRGVDHPNYGLLVDMGNFLCADELSLEALPTVMPYAFHVHAKDFIYKCGAEPCPDDSWITTRAGNYLRGTVVGHGIVPVAQCVRYVQSTGYTGNLSLEFEGLEEPLDAVRRGFEFLKKCIGTV